MLAKELDEDASATMAIEILSGNITLDGSAGVH